MCRFYETDVRYFVISDTHGSIDQAVRIGQLLCEASPPDGLIHLGDFADDAQRIARRLGLHAEAVSGNMDGLTSVPEHKIWDSPYGPVLLTHGHRQGVKRDLSRLLYRALELDCRAAIFGHTHVPVFTCEQGVYLLNPGSLTRPALGRPSYAMLEIDADRFAATIYYPEES